MSVEDFLEKPLSGRNVNGRRPHGFRKVVKRGPHVAPQIVQRSATGGELRAKFRRRLSVLGAIGLDRSRVRSRFVELYAKLATNALNVAVQPQNRALGLVGLLVGVIGERVAIVQTPVSCGGASPVIHALVELPILLAGAGELFANVRKARLKRVRNLRECSKFGASALGGVA